MDILQRLEQLKVRFAESQNMLETKRNEITEIVDEQKRMQGEYRLLIELGKEQGIIDDKGNPVERGAVSESKDSQV